MDVPESDNTVRVRDVNRLLKPRKKRPSDNPEAQQIRNKKRKLTATKQRGRLEFSYETDSEKLSLFNKLDTVKMVMSKGAVSGTSTYTALNQILDYFLERNTRGSCSSLADTAEHQTHATPTYQYVTKEEALQDDMFLCTRKAIDNLLLRIGEHGLNCTSGQFRISKYQKMKHACSASINCAGGHVIDWVSSPHVEGGKFLANIKMAHGFFASGMLPNQYERLCEGAGIGTMSANYRKSLQEVYSTVVEKAAKQSQLDALHEEIAFSVASGQDDGINILTDARHCWRRNARFTDVVCLGENTHKVAYLATVSTADTCRLATYNTI